MLKVGDRVVISAYGRERWFDEGCNPWDTEGVIQHIGNHGGLNVSVHWDNRCTNSYRLQDLELVTSVIGGVSISSLLRQDITALLECEEIAPASFRGTALMSLLIGQGIFNEDFHVLDTPAWNYLRWRKKGLPLEVKKTSSA